MAEKPAAAALPQSGKAEGRRLEGLVCKM